MTTNEPRPSPVSQKSSARYVVKVTASGFGSVTNYSVHTVDGVRVAWGSVPFSDEAAWMVCSAIREFEAKEAK